MDILLALQLMSCMVAFVLCMQLVLCPYEGTEFKAYNKSRRLNTISMGLLTLQFIVQMVFKIRANSVANGVACNYYFYLITSVLGMLAVLNLQQAGKLDKKQVIDGIAIVVVCYIVLTTSIFYKGGIYIKQADIFCSCGFLLIQIIYITRIIRSYKKMVKNMGEYIGAPVEDYVKWLKVANIHIFVAYLIVPFTLFSIEALTFFGFLFWGAQAYYISKFLYFGHFAKYVEESNEEETDNQTREQSLGAEDNSNKIEFNQRIEDRLTEWITKKGFCDSETTIVKLSNEIGTNRTSLSKHINANKGMTFREWINDLRIEEAKRLLCEDVKMNIEDLSVRCGFSSRKYFDQVFNNHEGISASQWRTRVANR